MFGLHSKRRSMEALVTASARYDAAIESVLKQFSGDAKGLLSELLELSNAQVKALLQIDPLKPLVMDAVLESMDTVPLELLGALLVHLTESQDNKPPLDFLACLCKRRPDRVLEAVRQHGDAFYRCLLASQAFGDVIPEKAFVGEIPWMSSTDVLGLILTHERLSEPVKEAARKRIQAILKDRELELEKQESERIEQEKEQQEDYGRGRYCTGCGGC